MATKDELSKKLRKEKALHKETNQMLTDLKKEYELKLVELKSVGVIVEELSSEISSLKSKHYNKEEKHTIEEIKEEKHHTNKSYHVVPRGNLVVLNGKKYDIMYRDTMKEVLDKFRKRFLEEENTVLVLDRYGS